MANKSKPQQEKVLYDPDVITDIPFEELTDPEIIAVDRMVKTLGDTGASVSVYRQGPGGYKDLTFLFACLPSEWITDGLQRLQRDYQQSGKGVYRLHVQQEDGTLKMNKGITVEALPEREKAKLAGATSAAPSGEMSAVLAAIAETNKTVAALAASMQSGPKPMDTVKDVVGLLRGLMPAQTAVNPAESLQSALTMAQALLNIGKSFAPAAPAVSVGKDGTVDAGGLALTKGIEIISRMFEQSLAGKPNSAPPSVIPAPAPNPVRPGPGEIQELTPDEVKQMSAIKAQLTLANIKAAAGTDPAEFVDDVYELIPDDVIVALATNPEWFAMLVSIDAECSKHREWYEKVRAEIIQAAQEDNILDGSGQPVILPASGDTVKGGGNGAIDAGNAGHSSGA